MGGEAESNATTDELQQELAKWKMMCRPARRLKESEKYRTRRGSETLVVMGKGGRGIKLKIQSASQHHDESSPHRKVNAGPGANWLGGH